MTRRRPLRGVLAAVLATLGLSACAGLPIGHGTFLVVGVGVVRVDKVDQARGISSRSVGLTLGCGELTIGAQGSYCAQLPMGDVAILERGAGPQQHLRLQHLRLKPLKVDADAPITINPDP